MGTKISEALVAVAEPLLDDIDGDQREVQGAMKIAMVAWNYAVMASQGHDCMAEALDDVTADADLDRAEALRAVMDMLVERKLAMFPDDDRFVAGVSVTVTDTGFDVQAGFIHLRPGPRSPARLR